jgi:hypothetical protein
MILKALLCFLTMFTLTLCSADTSSCQLNRDCTFNLLSGKISVSARLTDRNEDVDKHRPDYSFQIVISDRKHRYEVETGSIRANDLADAVNILSHNVRQKDGYIFVRYHFGGGNAWRGVVEGVFAIRKGQLQHIGDIVVGESRGTVANNYSEGLFMDYYDKFESNTLTDHSRAPLFKIFSREHDGLLHVDLDATWQRNLEDFQKGKNVWSQFPLKEKMSAEETWDAKFELLPILLKQAVIAKYCEHSNEMEEVLRKVERSFPEEVMKDFRAILDDVIPRELPESDVKRIQ